METFKKVMKIVGIIVAVAAAIAGIYLVVTKAIEKKNKKDEDPRENYVSCSCFDADFIAEETVS